MQRQNCAGENDRIRMEHVGMKFNGVTVLKQISLSIGEGEIFGLLGPSGAGKTTMIRILTGQLSPTEGRAVVLGEDSRKFPDQIYTEFGMVLDRLGLYERLHCYDNLDVFAHIYRLPRKRMDEVLEKVGLSGAAKCPVYKLSTGMKQRLALARAIMHYPKILFLDVNWGNGFSCVPSV